MLEWGKKKQTPGWARWHDAHVSDNSVKRDTSGQLTAPQNALLVEMKRATNRYAELKELAKTRGVKGQGPNVILQHAFGVGKTKVKECIQKYHAQNGTTERKKRSDAGKTMANSERKRNQACTPLNDFKKLKRKQHSGEVLKDAELKESYANLSEAAILQCNGGDEFVQERNGLSYGVRKVTQPLMEDDEGYTPDLATMEAPTRKVVGVKVCEVIEGVDVDKMKKLSILFQTSTITTLVSILTLMNWRSLQGTLETRTMTTSPMNRRRGTISSVGLLKTRVWRIIKMSSLLTLATNNSIHVE